jgi:hypothetical protein
MFVILSPLSITIPVLRPVANRERTAVFYKHKADTSNFSNIIYFIFFILLSGFRTGIANRTGRSFCLFTMLLNARFYIKFINNININKSENSAFLINKHTQSISISSQFSTIPDYIG